MKHVKICGFSVPDWNQCVYLEKLLLLCEAQYLRAHDAGAGLKSEYCANKWLCLALPLHHRRYLNHRVFVCFWEDSWKGSKLLTAKWKSALAFHQAFCICVCICQLYDDVATEKNETHLFFLHTQCQSWGPWAVRSSATLPLSGDLSILSIQHPPHTDTRTPEVQTKEEKVHEQL